MALMDYNYGLNGTIRGANNKKRRGDLRSERSRYRQEMREFARAAKKIRRTGEDYGDYGSFSDAIDEYYNWYDRYNLRKHGTVDDPYSIPPVNIYGNDNAKYQAFNDWFQAHPEDMVTDRNLRRYGSKYSPTLWNNYLAKVVMDQPRTKDGDYDFANPYIKALPDAYKKELFKSNVSERRGYQGLARLGTALAMSPVALSGVISPQGWTNFMLSTAAGEAVENGPRLFTDKGYAELLADSMFSKDTREKHPTGTEFAASMLNPGYYVSLGAAGLEYSGKILPRIVRDGVNGVKAFPAKAKWAYRDVLQNARNMYSDATKSMIPITEKLEVASPRMSIVEQRPNATKKPSKLPLIGTAGLAAYSDNKDNYSNTSMALMLPLAAGVALNPTRSFAKAGIDALGLIGKYQIKPLLKGAPIEKALSKSGTISRSQLDSYIKKQGKYYQEVMNDVLNKEFAGVDKIDYNAFKDAVAEKIPSYSFTDISKGGYRDYGLDRLGYDSTNYNTSKVRELLSKYDMRQIGENDILVRERATGRILTAEEVNDLNNKVASLGEVPDQKDIIIDNYMTTYDKLPESTLFSHFGPKNHAHTRTYLDKDNNRHVVEMQSDFFQSRGGQKDFDPRKPLELHMSKSAQERLIQDVIAESKRRGQNTVRFPTEDTAALVENFKKELDTSFLSPWSNVDNSLLNENQRGYLDILDKEVLLDNKEPLLADYKDIESARALSNRLDEVYRRVRKTFGEDYDKLIDYRDNLSDDIGSLRHIATELSKMVNGFEKKGFYIKITNETLQKLSPMLRKCFHKKKVEGSHDYVYFFDPNQIASWEFRDFADEFRKNEYVLRRQWDSFSRQFYEYNRQVLDLKQKIGRANRARELFRDNVDLNLKEERRLLNAAKKECESKLPYHYPQKQQRVLDNYNFTPLYIKRRYGIDMPIITDSKGNSWYEFDLNKYDPAVDELQFSLGGRLSNKYSLKSLFNNN